MSHGVRRWALGGPLQPWARDFTSLDPFPHLQPAATGTCVLTTRTRHSTESRTSWTQGWGGIGRKWCQALTHTVSWRPQGSEWTSHLPEVPLRVSGGGNGPPGAQMSEPRPCLTGSRSRCGGHGQSSQWAAGLGRLRTSSRIGGSSLSPAGRARGSFIHPVARGPLPGASPALGAGDTVMYRRHTIPVRLELPFWWERENITSWKRRRKKCSALGLQVWEGAGSNVGWGEAVP